MKACSKCKEIKSLDLFYKDRTKDDGLHTICISCSRDNGKKYFIKNKSEILANHKKYKEENKHKIKEWFKQYGLLKYNLTLEEFNNIYEKQRGKCLICNKSKKLQIDHNHKTKKVRGLLCINCNTALGLLKENVFFLQNAINYLENYGEPSVNRSNNIK